MKSCLIDLYNDSLVLAYNMNMSALAGSMLLCLHPGKQVEELSEEELIVLVKAVITGLTGQVC